MANISAVRGADARFPVRFLAALPLTFLLYQWSKQTEFFISATRSLVDWAASASGLVVERVGQTGMFFRHRDGAFSYEVIQECTALTIALLFAAAVFAYPASRKHRLIGLAVGLPLLAAMNIARLVSLAWIGILHRPVFEFVHVGVWQSMLVLGVALGWFAWVRYVVTRSRRTGRPKGKVGHPFTSLVLAFSGVLAALLVVGFVGRVIFIFGWTINHFARDLVASIWGLALRDLTPTEVIETFVWDYAAAAAAISLFLATPTVRIKERLKAAVLYGLCPIIVVVSLYWALDTGFEATGFLAGSSAQSSPAYMGGVRWLEGLDLVLRVGVPIAAWYAWARSKKAFFFMTRRHAGSNG